MLRDHMNIRHNMQPLFLYASLLLLRSLVLLDGDGLDRVIVRGLGDLLHSLIGCADAPVRGVLGAAEGARESLQAGCVRVQVREETSIAIRGK
jgi:hypothetical protein